MEQVRNDARVVREVLKAAGASAAALSLVVALVLNMVGSDALTSAGLTMMAVSVLCYGASVVVPNKMVNRALARTRH
jgi:hypothetical protein